MTQNSLRWNSFYHLHRHSSLILQWRHNENDDVSNHWHLDCLINRLFRHIPKKTSKLHVTGLCEGNPPGTGGFPSQRSSNMENVSIWWRHHGSWLNQYPTQSCPLPRQQPSQYALINFSLCHYCDLLEATSPCGWLDHTIRMDSSQQNDFI